MEHLEGDGAIMLRILSEVDCCHTSASKLSVYGVQTSQGNFQSFEWKHPLSRGLVGHESLVRTTITETLSFPPCSSA